MTRYMLPSMPPYGHQEQDTPAITQPLLYCAIASHPGARNVYAQQLMKEGVVTSVQVEEYVAAARDGLRRAHSSEAPEAPAQSQDMPPLPLFLDNYIDPVTYGPARPAQVRALARQISTVPDGYELHQLVGEVMTARRKMAAEKKPLDWGWASTWHSPRCSRRASMSG